MMKTLQWLYFTLAHTHHNFQVRQHGPRLDRDHPLCRSSSHSCRGNTNPAGPHQPSIPPLCRSVSFRHRGECLDVFHTTSLVLSKTQLFYFALRDLSAPLIHHGNEKKNKKTDNVVVAKKHTHTILLLCCLSL